MASITVDVQAKVVGYEASIKALQAALAKVNPGSDIGKKISAALTQAQKQVQDLSRNMFPKASSDNQIDAIVEKVNRVGEAIQNVSSMMQCLNIGDLNLGTLNGEIAAINNQVQNLQNSVNNTFNTGIREAVNNSEQLKQVFADLGVNINNMTAESGAKALAQGLASASQDAEKAKAQFEEATAKVDKLQASLASVKNANLFGGDFNLSNLLGDLGNFADPEKILSQQKLEELRNNICERIASLNLDNGSALQDKVTALFGEIDPKTTLEQFKQKWFMIQTELEQFGLKGKQITSVLGTSGNGQKLFESLVGFDESNLEEVKGKLLNVLSTFRSIFTDNQWNKITELIDRGSIEKASREGAQSIETAYNTYADEIKAGQAKIEAATDAKRTAEIAMNNAAANYNKFNNANEEYSRKILALEQQVDSLQKEVTNLRAQMEGKASTALTGIKNSALNAGSNAASNVFPTVEAAAYKAELEQVAAREQMVGKVQGVVQRWFSVYAAIRMVGNAVRSVISTIKELDATITEIAIVTDKSQSELWDQMPEYTQMARKYAASISGVYKVSQLYYQQGLGQSDVMALSEQTLKMARISGLDYAQATDYMTNAVRSFKLEMQDAQSVVDTYSAVAATSATSVSELATAMSKTASSAQAVGASLQNTTAMMAVMIEATRESPENIGSAMKSIISRYGELKENKTGIDEEGEEYSLNKVDTALQTVGISIHDVNGEFRDFDDVIMELAEHWDTIDKNTQRYIATVMAGNRQQSRFLALVSSGERLKELSETAADSEDASQLQFLKTLDSVDAKTQQLQTSLQSLYVNSGLEDLYKGVLDIGNAIATTLDNVASNVGLTAAIGKISGTFISLATLVTNIFKVLKTHFSNMQAQMTAEAQVQASRRLMAEIEMQGESNQVYNQETQSYITMEQAKTEALNAELAKRRAAELKASTTKRSLGMVASTIGLSTAALAASVDVNENRGLKAGLTGASSILQGVGTGLMIGGWPGAIMGILSALPGVFESLNMITESTEDKVKRLQSEVEQTNNNRIQAKDELKTLTDYKTKYEELSKTRNESVEKEKEFKDLQNEIAEAYPTLISSMDMEGNYIVDMTDAYHQLAEAKRDAYSEAFVKNLSAEINGLDDIDYVLKTIYGMDSESSNSFLGIKLDDYENLNEIFQKSLKEAPKFKDTIIPRIETTTASGKKTYEYDPGFRKMNAETKERMFFKDNITNAGLSSSYKSDIALDSLLSGVYNAYIQAASQGIAYQNVKIDTQAIFDEVAKEFTSPYAEINENSGKYRKALNYAVENFSATDYQRMLTVNKGTSFASDLRTNAIRVANTDYINTLNNSLGDLLGESGNKIQQYAIRAGLDDELNKYLKDNQNRIGNWDGKKGKYIDQTYLVDEFYNGTGKNTKNHNVAWYGEELQALDFLKSDKIEALFEALGTTSYKDIEQSLGNIPELAKDGFSATLAILQKAFNEQYEKTINRYKEWADQSLDTAIASDESKQIIKNFGDLFGPEYLQGIQNQYEDILKNSNLTDSQKSSQIETLNTIFTTIDSLSSELRGVALSKVQAADLTSVNGIYALIDTLKDAKFDFDGDEKDLKTQLTSLAKKLDVNITTEISTYLASLEAAAEGMEKDLSSAVNGMNVKDAQELADKLSKKLSEFTVRDGKFYFENVDEIVSYYTKVNDEFEEVLRQAAKSKAIQYTKLSSKFSSESVINSVDEWGKNEAVTNALQESFGINYTELMSYVKAFNNQDKFKDLYQFIASELTVGLDQGIETIKQWSTQQGAITALKNNGFEAFIKAAGLDTQLNEAQQQVLLAAAKAQNFTTLDEATQQLIQPYISTLLSTFKGAQGEVLNDLIDTVGTGKAFTVNVNQTNIDELKKLQSELGLFSGINFDNTSIINQQVSTLIENATGLEDYILNQIQTIFKTDAERLEAYQKYHAQKYNNNEFENFTNLTSFEDISYEEFTNYLSKNKKVSAAGLSEKYIHNYAEAYGLAMSASGDLYVKNWATYIAQLDTDLTELVSSGAALPDINAARTAIENARKNQQTSIQNATKDLISNYKDISVEQQAAFANAVNIDMSLIADVFYKLDSKGNTTLNVGALKRYVENPANVLTNAAKESILGMFADITDDYLKNITTATSLVSSGTSNQADIQKFTESAQQVNMALKESTFSFDAISKNWTLDPHVFVEYITLQAQQLVEAGLLAQKDVTDFLNKNAFENLANAIDVSSFLNSENQKGLGRDKLKKQLVDFLSVTTEFGDIADQTAESYIKALTNGGKKAVEVMKSIMQAQGKEVSASDVESAYRSEISQLEDAFDQLAYGPGSLISGRAKDIISTLEGYSIAPLDDNNAVITQIGDISLAYQAYYEKLSETNEATLAALNSAKAKVLETQNGRANEQQAIDALGQASGMTYSAFAEILSNAGIELTDEIINRYTESMGGNKMRIKDFGAFAAAMGWQTGSEEYTSAFKAYNDGLIELNRKAEKTIIQEVQGLSTAKGGDWINLTQLTSKLGEGATRVLNGALTQYGGYISGGILKLSSFANVLNIAQEVKAAAEAAGADLTAEVAELADVISSIIKSYSEAISKGITGGLTKVESVDLTNLASSLGVNNITFDTTVEGLKLSEQSAIALYHQLTQIDALSATLTFDTLSKSLRENNENFVSVSSILSHIANISRGIYAADSQVSQARLQQYEAELSVASQILAVRSTQEDSSFNFMSGDIPAAQKNPLNYAKNWTQALQTFRDAFDLSKVKKKGKTGFINYEDWYNIVTEMNNIAGISGTKIELGALTLDGKLESAAEAISRGARALTTVDTGDLKVNLGAIGIEIQSGAEAMQDSVTKGIQAAAKSQVSMLDGLIAMLEVIVAMEKLSDISGEDTEIDLGDIVIEGPDGQHFNEEYSKWVENIKDLIDANSKNYNKDLADAFNNIKIKGISLAEILDYNESQLTGENADFGKAYASLINAMVKAAQSGNYDLNNIAESVQQELAAAGLFDTPITIDVGETTLVFTSHGQAQIDWADEDIKSILDAGKTREELTDILTRYTTGIELGEQEVQYVLALKKKVILNSSGQPTSVIYDNHTYTSADSTAEQLNTLMYQAMLEDQGFAPKDITVSESGVVTTTKVYNGEKNITIVSDSTGVHWHSDYTGEDYGNESAMFDAEWDLWQERDSRGLSKEAEKYSTKEQYLFGEYGIRAQIKPKITVDNTDVTQDTGTQEEIRTLAAQGYQNIQKWIDANQDRIIEGKDGAFTIKLDSGKLFTFSSEGGTAINTDFYNALMGYLNLDGGMVDSIITGISQAFTGTSVSDALGSAIASAFTAEGVPLDNLKIVPQDISVDGDMVVLSKAISTATGEVVKLTITAQQAELDSSLNNVEVTATLAEGTSEKLQSAVTSAAESLKAKISADTSPLVSAVSSVKLPDLTVRIKGKYVGTEGGPTSGEITGSTSVEATGNLGQANAKGTLMGELGPELVVSDGRYFVVGQSGPEMVNLADDAIVFNHLQTKSLLEKGTSSGRGHAVTSEKKAISYAKGNIHGGPAKASAAAALAALKQLRAQWQALADLSAKDLAGKGGGGGGGGGNAAFIKDLERWYNLLQEIAKLEQKITYEQTLRKKIASDLNPNGEAYAKSQGRNLEYLRKEVAAAQQLSLEQEDYFNQRRKELNAQNGPFSSLYEFDEMGQLKYKSGAFALLSERFGGDTNTGEPNYSVKDQYEWLLANGYGAYMKYNESGEEIKVEGKTDEKNMKAAIEAFWAKIEADRSEMQELHDSVEEQKKAVLEKMQEQNELLKEVEENQINVEGKVLKAIESAAKREIDELKDQRDAFEKSNTALIDGLTNALDQERKMYDTQQSEDELETKRRRLEILRRSGGSASEISSLQAEIDSSTKDLYFDKQQEQIDTIQKASDAQLERLDAQIDLMTESLEYQKEHGMLWQQVYQVMEGSPEQIATFIQQNDSDYWGKSPTDLAKNIREDLFEAEQYVAYRDTVTTELNTMANLLANQGLDSEWDNFGKMMSESKEYKDAWNRLSDDQKNNLKAIYAEELRNSGDPNAAARKVWESQLAIDYGITKKKEEPATMTAPETATTPTAAGGGGNGSEGWVRTGNETGWKYDDNQHWIEYEVRNAKGELKWWKKNKGTHVKSQYDDDGTKKYFKCKTCGKEMGFIYAGGYEGVKTKRKFGSGGLVTSPTEALIGETGTEAVLNPEQTKILRENILGHSPNSLVNLLKDYNAAYKGLSSNTYDSISNNSYGGVIEHAEVNVHVDKLANGYDAAQAGDDIMREMLNIARKTGAQNRVGR